MLLVDGLRVTIKGFIILRGVSLVVPTGELIALVGRNGAGKTSTLKSIMGLMPISGGTVQLDGTALKGVQGYRRAALGIGYMPEARRLIGCLTGEDNIRMPAWASRLAHGEARLAYIYEKMPDVAALARRRASALSGGQQKMVALARAVMSGTKLLLLDEPFEGLSPAMGERLAATIRQLRSDGASVCMAESDLKRIAFADEIFTIYRAEIAP